MIIWNPSNKMLRLIFRKTKGDNKKFSTDKEMKEKELNYKLKKTSSVKRNDNVIRSKRDYARKIQNKTQFRNKGKRLNLKLLVENKVRIRINQ